MNIIKAVNLVFDYIRRDEEGQVEEVKRALDHVNLEIEKGSFVAILGHNGSGKSTFAKQINGILSPTDGTLFVSEMDTRDEAHLWDIHSLPDLLGRNSDIFRTESDVLFHYISYDLVIRVLKDHARIFADIPQMRLVPEPSVRRTEAACGDRGRHGDETRMYRAR